MAIPILSDIFGQKPEVAGFEDVDFGEEQLNALMGNIEAWPKIEELGNLYQQYMLGSYEKAFPGFADIMGLGAGTTKQMLEQAQPLLRGEIPQDVADQIRRSTAFTSLMGGTAGSPMSKALTARDLGRTSLDLITQGANLATTGGNAAQRWAGIAGGTIMSPAGFVITPAQQAEMTMTNRLIQRQVQQERYNVAAAPDPVAKGLSDLVANLTGAYLGGMSGGGMGGGGGGQTAPAAMDWSKTTGTTAPTTPAGYTGGPASSWASSNMMSAGGGGVPTFNLYAGPEAGYPAAQTIYQDPFSPGASTNYGGMYPGGFNYPAWSG